MLHAVGHSRIIGAVKQDKKDAGASNGNCQSDLKIEKHRDNAIAQKKYAKASQACAQYNLFYFARARFFLFFDLL